MTRVPAAQHALSILNLLIRSDAPLSAARICAELNLPRSSTYQLLAVMVDSGFVVHLKDQRTYGLGAAAYSMSQAYMTQQPLVRATAKHAHALATVARGSAHVSRLSGTEVVYVLEERFPGAVSLITDVGVRLPAHITASGRVMLAALAEPELKARIDNAGLGGQWRQLTTKLDVVRRQGWAEEYEEVTHGQHSIAVAIVDHMHRPAAALAVTFRAHSLSATEITDLITQTQRRAATVETIMFGRH